MRGHILFGERNTFSYLNFLFESGAEINKTRLTEEFDYGAFQRLYGEAAAPLFLIKDTWDEPIVFATDNEPSPKPGQILISLVNVKNKALEGNL